jgi:hypothetical protein
MENKCGGARDCLRDLATDTVCVEGGGLADNSKGAPTTFSASPSVELADSWIGSRSESSSGARWRHFRILHPPEEYVRCCLDSGTIHGYAVMRAAMALLILGLRGPADLQRVGCAWREESNRTEGVIQ